MLYDLLSLQLELFFINVVQTVKDTIKTTT